MKSGILYQIKKKLNRNRKLNLLNKSVRIYNKTLFGKK